MTPDLVTMLENLSNSLGPVEQLMGHAAVLVGLLFLLKAVTKFKKIGDARARSSSQERMFVPIMYVLAGAALIYLPSSIATLSQTAFGTENVLAYGDTGQANVINSIEFIIEVVGVIWFMRGCALLAHASEPGIQHGPKGLAFLVAGIFAVNFKLTMTGLDYVLEHLIHLFLSFKRPTGD